MRPLELPQSIDADTTLALRSFLKRVAESYEMREGILFGSRARGSFRPDSDVDLAVVLAGDKGDRSKIAMEMAEIAFDVLMETGLLVEALPLWEGELEQPERFSNPDLIRNIKKDGIRFGISGASAP